MYGVKSYLFFLDLDKFVMKLMKIVKIGFDFSKIRSFKYFRNLCMKIVLFIWFYIWRGFEDIGEKFIIRI